MCPPGSTPPASPPSADELRSDSVVVAAIEQAWEDSLPDDPAVRHEEGGWIYMDTTTGGIATRRQSPGGQASINLSTPPIVLGSVVVGKFHTHPNPTAEGWNGGPSAADVRLDALHGVPDIIRADDGFHLSGPDARRGGLRGGPGFPGDAGEEEGT
jgi:hypothetical protein